MKHDVFVISIEELAYAMGVEGGAEVASDFLSTLLGPRPRIEVEGRLLAASHGLVSRGLLDFEIETGAKRLTPDLATAILPLLANNCSIRCSRIIRGEEDVMTFFVASSTVIEHRLDRQIVSRLEFKNSVDDAVERCVQFFELESLAAPSCVVEPLVEMPVDLLDSVRSQLTRFDDGEIALQLEQAGMTSSDAKELTVDLKQADQYSSVTRIEQRNGQAVADEGFLLLKRENRLWLFVTNSTMPPTLTVYRSDIQQLRIVLTKLFR
jgi:hypothetical protein